MSAFINHGIQGGFIYWGVVYLISYFLKLELNSLAYMMFGIGMMFGVKPDLDEWVARKSGFNKYFELDYKYENHLGILAKFNKEPVSKFHTWQDKIFWHNPKISQWVKDLVETFVFILSAIMLLLVFKNGFVSAGFLIVIVVYKLIELKRF